MSRNELTALGLLAAAFIGGAGLAAAAGASHVPWYISRASGIGAFVALSLSVILGLLTSMRVALPGLSKAFNYEIHGFVSVLGLALTGIHGGALLFDSWFQFTPAQVLVPFISAYEPVWTGIGIIATWAMALVTASFWMRKWVGQRAWRRLHYLSFGVYLLAFVHGILAGTDTAQLPIALTYAASISVVAMLLALRIMLRGEKAAARAARSADTPDPWPESPEPAPRAAAALWYHRTDGSATTGSTATNPSRRAS